MAILHRAELVPAKLVLLSEWSPSQPWSGGSVILPLRVPGAFRFDDPGGKVGMETFIVGGADGRTFHVPVTYRGAPLEGAPGGLVGTTKHSVLGERWVYDGCTDPVYVRALLRTILTGGRQADMYYQAEEGLQRRETTTYAWGTGSAATVIPVTARFACRTARRATVIEGGNVQVVLRRELDGPRAADAPPGAPALLATWPEQEDPVTLAWAAT